MIPYRYVYHTVRMYDTYRTTVPFKFKFNVSLCFVYISKCLILLLYTTV